MGLVTSGPKENKSLVFLLLLLCALWLIPLLSQLGDSGLNKLVWSCFGHPVYSSPYKPQGFSVDTWYPRGGLSLSKQLPLERVTAQLKTLSQEGFALGSIE